MSEFADVIKEGDTRDSLIAMRDFIVDYLEALQHCPRCQRTEIRSGELASLMLRLDKIIQEIAEIPDPAKKTEEEDELAELRQSRYGTPESEDTLDTDKFGTKSAKRRQGGRRPRVNGGS